MKAERPEYDRNYKGEYTKETSMRQTYRKKGKTYRKNGTRS